MGEALYHRLYHTASLNGYAEPDPRQSPVQIIFSGVSISFRKAALLVL